MMKKLRNIIILIALFVASGFCVTNVNAQSTMVLNKVTYIKSGVAGRTETGFATNKGWAYCISPYKNTPPNGTKLYYKGNINDGGLLYLLRQAKSSNKSIVLTRIAVWKYYNGYMVNAYKNNPNASVVKQAKSLASTAKKNKSKTDKNPSARISASSSKMTEVSGGYYYKSKAITVKLGNVSSASISVTSPAIIVNGSDRKVTTVKNGSKVYVRVPASKVNKTKSFTVKVTASKKVQTVEKYSPKNSKYQNLIVLGSTKKTATAKVTVSATPIVRTCQYANGKYYGKDGRVVDQNTYNLECKEHRCEIIGNHYFGPDGDEVDQATYDLECNKHVCQKVGDTYFGKDGTEVDEETYNLECFEHKCEVIDDKYYGKDGTEVDEETYNLECKEHKCEKIGDKYFGIAGDEVTEEEYKDQCMHFCEMSDGKFYGKNGDEVTEQEYKDQCEEQVVEVPDTGNSPLTNLLLTMFGAFIVGTSVGVVKYFQKNNG